MRYQGRCYKLAVYTTGQTEMCPGQVGSRLNAAKAYLVRIFLTRCRLLWTCDTKQSNRPVGLHFPVITIISLQTNKDTSDTDIGIHSVLSEMTRLYRC